MALQFYSDSGLTQRIVEIVGSLSDSGSQFNVSEEPAEVRIFESGKPYGQLLTKNTSTPTSPSSGEWGYSAGVVYLGDALSSGQTAVAFSTGTRIFEGVNTLSGLAKFLTSSADADDRTKQQQIWIGNTASDRKYTDVSVSAINDLLSGEGADPSWIELAPDNSGSPGTWQSAPLSLSDIAASGSTSFWIKCVVPQGTPVENLRDVYVTIQAYEESTN